MKQAENGNSSKYVLFLGASHILGFYGASFVKPLRPFLQGLGTKTVASGVNGQLADRIGSRLAPALERHGAPAAVVIMAGTNNVITANYNLYYKMYRKSGKTAQPATLQAYIDSLTSMLQLLQQQAPSCKVFLITLPPVSELPTHPLWDSIAEHNKVMKEVAASFSNATVVDFNETCHQYLKQHASPRTPPRGCNLDLPFWQTALRVLGMVARNKLLLQSWDKIAAGRGRLLLHDDIHLNNIAAHLLATQLQPVLRAALAG